MSEAGKIDLEAPDCIAFAQLPNMVEKRIISRQHLDAFLNSQTHTDIVDFVNALNQSTIGVTLRQDCLLSEVRSMMHPA
jgi:hypothetical protein